MSGTKAKNLALAAGSKIDSSGNVEADTLDTIDSLEFLRSDQSDTMTGVLNLQKTISTYEDLLRITNYTANGDVIAAISYDQSIDTLIIRNDQGFATGGIALNVGGDPGTTGIFLRTDGNVGIGTSSPGAKLDVRGSMNLRLDNGLLFFTDNNTAGATNVNGGFIGMAHNAGYHVTASDGGFGSNANSLLIGNYHTGGGDIILATTNAGPYASGRVIIKESGNVGIGTDSPNAPLDVTSSRSTGYSQTGDQRGLAHIIARNGSDASGRFASISLVSGGGTQAEGSINLVQTGNYVGDLTFKLRAGSGSADWRERMRISSDGSVLFDNVNGHQLSHRNLINNGGMQIAQRNASFAITTSGYQYNCLDRWGNYYAGTTVGQQEQLVLNQLKKVMRITATSSTSNLYTFQWIENGGKILCNGERFSISFKARSSVASGKTCTVQMRYGNAGAGSTSISDTIGSASLTNSFQQFKFENVDASSFNYTQAGLWLWMPGPSTGDYIEITDVQIELGSKATEFEQKSIAQEMNDCMRFYQRLQGNRDGSGGAAGDRGIFHMHNWGASNWYGIHHFNVPMRTGPTLKAGFSGSHLGTWFSGGNTGDATSMQIQNANAWRAELSGNHSSSFLQGGSCWLRLGTDTDYVAFDAEYL